MESHKIRASFLSYFEEKGFSVEASSSLVPANDPTLLFTNAGMVQFKDAFLGIEDKGFTKACTSQKCVRAGGKHNDLEQVGLTARHHTFFEMLGHFMFSGASKQEAISDAWTLLTKIYKIPQEKLIVTVFRDDQESRDVWENVIGLNPSSVISCGEKDNFWSMGDTGPCGPCTEIFYDHGEAVAGGPPGSVDEDGDRFVEIWNLVFMQYNMKADGSRENLPSLGLDTGMGLERISAVLQGLHNNFETDLFMPIIERIQKINHSVDLVTARVIADHIRSSVFLISDGVYPSNEGRGYVLRRIMRRAIGFAYNAGVTDLFMCSLADIVVEIFAGAYPELTKKSEVIKKVIQDEENRFSKTIGQGMKLLESLLASNVQILEGADIFKLYDTYGFPLDMTEKIAQAKGIELDYEGYKYHMSKQQERSRASAQFSQTDHAISSAIATKFIGYDQHVLETELVEIWNESASASSLSNGQEGVLVLNETVFYPEGGGQIGDQGMIKGPSGTFSVLDTQKVGRSIIHIGQMVSGSLQVGDQLQLQVDEARQSTACNHSVTHLLHAALRNILGPHVLQKGSLVSAERLRFDFAHPKPLTEEQLRSVERCVNLEIRRNHAREVKWMSLEQAKQEDIMALFDEKYEDEVRVMQFGEFSKELCGGVHVQATGEIGLFVITQETGIASGVRRIEALTGESAINHMHHLQIERLSILKHLKSDPDMLLLKLESLVKQEKQSRKDVASWMKKLYANESSRWVEEAEDINGTQVIAEVIDSGDVQVLRSVMDSARSVLREGVIMLLGKQSPNHYMLLIASQNCSINAADVLKELTQSYEGSGGGKPAFAQGKIKHDDAHQIIQKMKDKVASSNG